MRVRNGDGRNAAHPLDRLDHGLIEQRDAVGCCWELIGAVPNPELEGPVDALGEELVPAEELLVSEEPPEVAVSALLIWVKNRGKRHFNHLGCASKRSKPAFCANC
jgi:hypothetical protein